MTKPIDYKMREQALLPTQSMIAQAPAGSGKTELLIQRTLKLLSTVEEPENVLAITFTRKAASEIRTRVMGALELARQGVEPSADPELTTYRLGLEVLERSRKLQWDLDTNPARLQLLTIDSLCSSIAKNAPLTNSFGSMPKITEDPSELYRKAVKATLRELETPESYLGDSIEKLYRYLDNHMMVIEDLMVSMLGKRQQWLQFIVPMGAEGARDYLESVLTEECEKAKNSAYFGIPKGLRISLQEQFEILNDQAIQHGFDPVYSSESDRDSFLVNAVKFLLKNDYNFRATLTKAQGVLAQTVTKVKEEKEIIKAFKDRAIDVLRECAAVTKNDENQAVDLAALLKTVHKLPAQSYSDEQWEIMTALIEVMKHCVGSLKIVFAEQGLADFTEIAQSALTALGMNEHPSDLALSLDYKIQHILVDEFQDTSIVQYQLLELLTSGWEHNDGRTLFVVGDPMQAIYRFRDAEVANFIKARKNGIGEIDIHPLHLKQNFRSDSLLVNTFNDVFKDVFAVDESLEKGEVAFEDAAPFKSDVDATNFTADGYDNLMGRGLETKRVVDLVKNAQQDIQDGSVAILARSRSHLYEIATALKDADIAFNSVEMEKITERVGVLDLLSIARAIYRHADNEAWAGLLRSPFMSLNLQELELVFKQAKHLDQVALEVLQDPLLVAQFSDNAQSKVEYFNFHIKPLIDNRFLRPIEHVISDAAVGMGLRQLNIYKEQQGDIDFALKYLASVSVANDLPGYHKLYQGLESKFSSSTPTGGAYVHLMTIHKSKGLQFDTVILPGLDRRSGMPDPKLMNLQVIYTDQGDQNLLLAPLKSAAEQNDKSYDYINSRSSELEVQEMKRLLYVAMTRAKHRLHMVYCLTMKDGAPSSPAANTLLGVAWAALKNKTAIHSYDDVLEQKADPKLMVPSIAGPDLERINAIVPMIAEESEANLESLDTVIAKAIGDLLHLELEVMALNKKVFTEEQIQQRKEHYRSQLLETGLFCHGIQLSKALSEVTRMLSSAVNNEDLVFYLKPTNGVSTPELELQSTSFDYVKTHRIDLLFQDGNSKVVIDYKSDRPYSDETEIQFIERIKGAYRDKMHQYQRLVADGKSAVSGKLFLLAINKMVTI